MPKSFPPKQNAASAYERNQERGGGCRSPISDFHYARRTILERTAKEGESPVSESVMDGRDFLSKVGHVKSGPNLGGPPSKAKQMQRSIADSTVRER